ncbi:L-threonylcarbamoyladenylate synthase [Sediminicurvatus halobius]|uniref:Threonylcarbamoyl-AMP synthase n=1 Tax=Sediminicurvatus halobius TaxID=2182432 RepID=A0A2U2MZ70_9GAMM|nr:Sua5/YciO/YrdC/YwlC family protein [Spiribacter halobius]PWG62226.1 tRNA threonylcarbamoyladenosine biosynthesis protein RimN [Spiribacter halobius]UEX78135.1 Sua5/YciO/YrdC/YwlC family protein [Spiribacter halobius]
MRAGFRLQRVADRIRAGGVGAYPTEGVWGLGCRPDDAAAIDRLLELKQRPPAKGLILIAADFGQLEPFARLPEAASRRAAVLDSWPGPVTWILEATPEAPDVLTGGRDTLAARVSAHPPVVALCRAAGLPLISTSANLSGRPALRRSWQVRRAFGERLDWLWNGPLGGLRGPTEIRDGRTGQVLRPGRA